MTKPGFFSPDHPAYPTLILINVIMTTFLAICSAVATIIGNSSIQGELALSDTQSIWITTLYLLGVNTTVPASTWFASHFGYKRMYTFGVLIFTLSSALVGLSGNFPLLALARITEGIGAGLLFPIGLALIIQNTPKERIPLAFNLYVAISFGGGIALGIPLSGYFSQFGSWRTFFLLIIPFGLAAAYSCWLSRRKRAEEEKFPFDTWGFFFFVLFISSLLVALTLGPIKSTTEGWRSWYIIALFIVSACSLVSFILIERKHPHPIVPLVLFKDPLFATGCAALFIIGMSLFASVSVSVDYMLNALFYEKYVTGKIATIYGVMLAVCSVLANMLIKWVPVPLLILIGLSCLVYSYFLNNQLSWLTGVDQVFWILVLRGIGVGLSLGPTNLLTIHGVPAKHRNTAATLLTFFRQVGATYGGTILSLFAIRRTIFHAARFGEQANDQLPAYKMTIQNLYDKYPDPTLAKAEVIKNIEIQAYVQGLNDSLIIFGYVTGVIGVILLILITYKVWKSKKQSASSLL